MSDETLFELEPAALVYRWPTDVPMHRMKCRECHQKGAVNGGGLTHGYAYAICDRCFRDRGDVGDRARRAGFAGRELFVIEAVAA